MNYYTLLVSFIFVWIYPCNGGSAGNDNPFVYKMLSRAVIPSYSLDEIDMKMGDRIDCVSHILLATDSGNVIHIVAEQNKGHIAEEPISALSGKKYECRNRGPGPRGAWESVQLARWQKSYFESLGRDFFYEFFTCNCEQWLNFWTGNSISSFKSILPTSPDCEVLNLTPEFFNSATDCWWTGCQLDSWKDKGCKQYGRWERDAHNCDGGRKYHCCKK